MLRIALTLLPLLPVPQDLEELREAVPLDRVVLKSGRSHEGRVLLADEERVLLLVGSREKEFEREDVDRLESVRERLRSALPRIDAALAGDASGLLELARELREGGLPLEARLLCLEVLLRDPGQAEAHEWLGQRKINGRWRARVGNGWQPFEDLDQLHAEWNDARELCSTHFDVRTNLPLTQALAAVWRLERTYASFYELFGSEFVLYETVEPMQSWVYATFESFPEMAGQRSYFSIADERAYIGAGGSDLETFLHETTHQLLHSSAKAIGRRASIPGWLGEGLAQYLPAALDEHGRRLVDVGERAGFSEERFVTHARNEDPYGIKRVLNFDWGDFHGSSRQPEKYSQAYTLTHYLLHADSGAHRESFVAYVRCALHEGQASSTDFKKVLDIDREEDFEAAWLDYAKRMAQ